MDLDEARGTRNYRMIQSLWNNAAEQVITINISYRLQRDLNGVVMVIIIAAFLHLSKLQLDSAQR